MELNLHANATATPKIRGLVEDHRKSEAQGMRPMPRTSEESSQVAYRTTSMPAFSGKACTT
jgi:hypothetical protein